MEVKTSKYLTESRKWCVIAVQLGNKAFQAANKIVSCIYMVVINAIVKPQRILCLIRTATT